MALCAACGLATMVTEGADRSLGWILAGAALAGAAVTATLAELRGSAAQAGARDVVLCYGALVAIAAAVMLVTRSLPRLRRVSLPCAAGRHGDFYAGGGQGDAGVRPVVADRPRSADPGGSDVGRAMAARSLITRRHRGHQHRLHAREPLLFRHRVLVSAYPERRVLLEVWGFSTRGDLIAERLRVSLDRVPFWDRRLPAANIRRLPHPLSPRDRAVAGRLRGRMAAGEQSLPHPAGCHARPVRHPPLPRGPVHRLPLRLEGHRASRDPRRWVVWCGPDGRNRRRSGRASAR
jgi:hypothetical protein